MAVLAVSVMTTTSLKLNPLFCDPDEHTRLIFDLAHPSLWTVSLRQRIAARLARAIA